MENKNQNLNNCHRPGGTMNYTSLIGNEAAIAQTIVFNGEKGNAYQGAGNWLHACFAILLGISPAGIDLCALSFIHEAMLPNGTQNEYYHGRDVVGVINRILDASTVNFKKRLCYDGTTGKIHWK